MFRRLLTSNHPSLPLLGVMMFFWCVFDGAMAYIAPIAVTQHNFSKTEMGFIIGASSMVGALFDLLSFKILPSTHYRRVFMIMFALCATYPIVLYGATSIPLFLLAMAIWGIYYDLKNFGNLDFIGRYTKKEDHAKNFGFVQIFQSLGYLVAPIAIGMIIVNGLDWKAFGFALAALFISSVFFFELQLRQSREAGHVDYDEKHHLRRKQFSEIKLWLSLDKTLFPVLMMTLMIYVVDALFWTVGPLFAESFSGAKEFAGLIMTAYSLPALMVGWIVGAVAKRLGKKRTAYGALVVGMALLSCLIFTQVNFFATLALIFASSMFISIALPTVNGVYADLITEKSQYEHEIESLSDFYTNLGFVIGPISAGYLADSFGNAGAFSVVGAIGFIVAIFLYKIAPEKIHIKEA